jgi:allantoate deiminase
LAAQVLARCDEIAHFSEHIGRITRTFLSEPVRRLHVRLTDWMEDANLAVRIDPAGNLIGHYAGPRPDLPVLMIGSHLDSVPDGGKYDGPLGVMLGLAAVQSLGGRRLPFGIDVIGFSEEEGVRYRAPFLGSTAVCGRFDRRLLDRVDCGGITMAEAFRNFGLDPSRIGQAAYPKGAILGYIEPHIEQGPVLESLDLSVGIVDAIIGQTRILAELSGRAGHAGTLPMEARLDALPAAAEVVLEAERLPRSFPGLRATVGTLTVVPGAINVVPGATQLGIDLRHVQDAERADAVAELKKRASELAARRGVEFRVTQEENHPAVPTDPFLSGLLAEAVVKTGRVPHRMTSGAGHDAAVMASVARMAMLFLRSPGGVSHHPEERVLPEDVVAALDVLVHYLNLLADRLMPG